MGIHSQPAPWANLSGSIRVVCLPDDDAEFGSRVRGAVARIDSAAHHTTAAIMAVLQDLLPTYPSLTIRQQDGLASFEVDPTTWYVYRDGKHPLDRSGRQ